MNKKTKYLTSFFCFIFVLITCFSCKKNEKEKPIDTVTSNYSDSLAFNKVVEKPQEGDRILWSDKNIKIYVNHSIIEEGEEKLVTLILEMPIGVREKKKKPVKFIKLTLNK